MTEARSLADFPIHLGLGASAVAEPQFSGMDWYEAYAERHAEDMDEGRLVSLFRFDEPWTSWEMHPHGEEVVLCLEGRMTLHQENADGSAGSVELGSGDYVIIPRGTWHTADCDGSVTALFITAGKETEHRPR
ncbi:MAG TPA: cupin domain-containing protein [Sphingomicrobium sp.]|jgi:mannose-6-phosphate isomerase-like protein (cupin superfamily)